MLNYIWPILVIIGCNSLYQVACKQTPQSANAFLSLSVTYLVAAALCLSLFALQTHFTSFGSEVSKLNWTSWVLGMTIVGLEVGSIFMYRAGWNINTGSLVANIGLAISLVFIGFLFYKEAITMNKMIGILLCIAGLIMINR
ncbi:MAG: hypothetical protein ACOYJJ_02280 [Anaerovoracaceae bacterium]|jgi:uncharacterized membrane protein